MAGLICHGTAEYGFSYNGTFTQCVSPLRFTVVLLTLSLKLIDMFAPSRRVEPWESASAKRTHCRANAGLAG